jgi:endonuclease G
MTPPIASQLVSGLNYWVLGLLTFAIAKTLAPSKRAREWRSVLMIGAMCLVGSCVPTPRELPPVQVPAQLPAQLPMRLQDCAHMFAVTGLPLTKGEIDPQLFFCKTGHAGYFNSEHRISDWVVEVLTQESHEENFDRDGFSYANDTSLPKHLRVSQRAYTNSTYTRGHLAPAGDLQYSEDALRDSFHMSNIAPQIGDEFNSSTWKTLEECVRKWQVGRGTLIVFTGTIVEGVPKKLVTNASKPSNRVETEISIPTHFYKIIYAPKDNTVQAFLFRHGNVKGRKVKEFRAKVREIETMTGYDFLSQLPRSEQDRLETRLHPKRQSFGEPCQDNRAETSAMREFKTRRPSPLACTVWSSCSSSPRSSKPASADQLGTLPINFS